MAPALTAGRCTLRKHPDTTLSLNNLGFLPETTGDYEAARPYYERALAILMARLGPDHPYTRTVGDNLAALLERINQASS